MKLSLSVDEFKSYVLAQLDHLYPDGRELNVERTEYCFAHIKVYKRDSVDNPFFYHLNSEQYSQFFTTYQTVCGI